MASDIQFDQIQDTENSDMAVNYVYYAVKDPSVIPLMAVAGTIAIGVGRDPNVKGKLWQKQDDGLTTNWVLKKSADEVSEPVKGLWYDLKPEDGAVLPVSAARAYYADVLYSETPIFFDGSTNRKYLAMYGTADQAVAFSDDGVNWDNETLVQGLQGDGYHGQLCLVGTTLHLFYWDTSVSIYGNNAIRHATFDITVDCVNALSDLPLSGDYIHGGAVMDLRRGTYGAAKVFYNESPTNDPSNPYSYRWCMIHNGTDGNNEGILFATSDDGLDFSIWNGLNEAIPRESGEWDAWVGGFAAFIDDAGLWHCFYSGGLGTLSGEDVNYGGGIGYATSKDGITWVKHVKNPILLKTESFKSWKRCYNPVVVRDGEGYFLYYTAKGVDGLYKTVRAKINTFI